MTDTYCRESPLSIRSLFARIAPAYDRTNALLSFGLFKQWNRLLVRRTLASLSGPILDLCAGTGEIGLNVLHRCHQRQRLILLDFCPQMLELARLKAQSANLERHDISYLQADAQSIPLPDASVAVVTTAYGIRNIADPIACAHEVRRVLRPNGVWHILELTRPRAPGVRTLHQLYLRHLLPAIGRLATSDREAYRYLSNSIQNFIDPQQLATRLGDLGYVSHQPASLLFGTATLLSFKIAS